MPTVDLTYKYDTEEMLGEQGRWYLDQLELHRTLAMHHQREYQRYYEAYDVYIKARIVLDKPAVWIPTSNEEPGK